MCPFCLPGQYTFAFEVLEEKNYGAMHHSLKFLQNPAITYGFQLPGSLIRVILQIPECGNEMIVSLVFLCENVISIWLNQHIVPRTVKQMLLQSFIKSWSV